jgi:hypothetical protein
MDGVVSGLTRLFRFFRNRKRHPLVALQVQYGLGPASKRLSPGAIAIARGMKQQIKPKLTTPAFIRRTNSVRHGRPRAARHQKPIAPWLALPSHVPSPSQPKLPDGMSLMKSRYQDFAYRQVASRDNNRGERTEHATRRRGVGMA